MYGGIYGLLRLLTLTLLLPDDDNYLDNSLQDVGEIKLVVYKVKITNSEIRLPGNRNSETLQPTKIHERAKKGLAHQIK